MCVFICNIAVRHYGEILYITVRLWVEVDVGEGIPVETSIPRLLFFRIVQWNFHLAKKLN